MAHAVDGVTIWRAADVQAVPHGNGIRIAVKRFLGFKRLVVEGVAGAGLP